MSRRGCATQLKPAVKRWTRGKIAKYHQQDQSIVAQVVNAHSKTYGRAFIAALPLLVLTYMLALSLAFAGLAVGLVGLVGGAFVLFTDGFPQAPPLNAAAQSAANVIPLALPDPSQPGPYTVRTLTYGSGVDRRRPEYGAEADLHTTEEDIDLSTTTLPGGTLRGANLTL